MTIETEQPEDKANKENSESSGKKPGSGISQRRLKKRAQRGRRSHLGSKHKKSAFTPPRYAAIDLGTNNCRLLVAAPSKQGVRIVDAFSRIVRLGEGVAQSGKLSQGAMDRTIEALKICAEKISYRRVTSLRCIATQACRGADNGAEFLARIERETNLKFDLINTEEEASLSVKGCMDLMDPNADLVVVFDIGGGSTEISWVVNETNPSAPHLKLRKIAAWTSLPFGVVTLAEKFSDRELSRETYNIMVGLVAEALRDFTQADHLKPVFAAGNTHLLGTSGTVTSLAGYHLGLKKYIRSEVDGIWLASERALELSEKLRALGLDGRAKEACIGPDRADLVVPGCAILEGILTVWQTNRIRVADRGLREGILAQLMEGDKRRKKKRNQKRKHRKN
ncbi:MAG: Ppx/GppA phosphatase family protein [bacterium]